MGAIANGGKERSLRTVAATAWQLIILAAKSKLQIAGSDNGTRRDAGAFLAGIALPSRSLPANRNNIGRQFMKATWSDPGRLAHDSRH